MRDRLTRMAGYTYLWQFRVHPEHAAEFARQYGPGGEWVSLFRQAPGYIDTWLLRDRTDPFRFLTIDRWESAQAHAAFRASFAREYAELDARCAHLTVEESPLGDFEEASRVR
jgi:heme-degrading monooxygenase HmoA